MPNGKITTRDMVIRIDERTENIAQNLAAHIKNHQWFLGIIIGIPAAILAIIIILR